MSTGSKRERPPTTRQSKKGEKKEKKDTEKDEDTESDDDSYVPPSSSDNDEVDADEMKEIAHHLATRMFAALQRAKDDDEDEGGITNDSYVPTYTSTRGEAKETAVRHKRLIIRLSARARQKAFEETFKDLPWYPDLTFDSATNEIAISRPIVSLRDMVDAASLFRPEYGYSNLDVFRLHRVAEHLAALDGMIGMDAIKKSIVNHIKFALMDPSSQGEFSHMVITGPPGVGKTTVAAHIGLILSSLRCKGKAKRSRPRVVMVQKPDLISKWVAETASLVRDKFRDATDGVLIIDEAYQLGVEPGETSNNRLANGECLNMMNQLLSEMKDRVVVVLIGYGNLIQERIFDYNEGLARRFPYRYDIKPYASNDLWAIFVALSSKEGWLFADSADCRRVFESVAGEMLNNGGDCETLLAKYKICAAAKQFGLHKEVHKEASAETLVEAIEKFRTETRPPRDAKKEMSMEAKMMFL